jgi:predicted nucleic acid-binding protein
MAEGTAAGGPRNAADMINAATAGANSCTLVTADYRDFRGAANAAEQVSLTTLRKCSGNTRSTTS